ncbi:hypothetical protein EIN_085640 [Entamoeba invadens IP1]|uniref:hypothetical protein n=1 Tax=Entamoeba invadens IP1 TaxID=370355 RepID=UPI0002C3EDEF|nr:hypothetical protein EIN_085640 [Entamoeba invadens IP1]ELP85322.1 hypothetical protein EIN_085640 [Entamoeba invadens IP1]|eukprot:XP_004184668.1 hypothetical protein EIN_085640 [Entamoeba invadens IP1]
MIVSIIEPISKMLKNFVTKRPEIRNLTLFHSNESSGDLSPKSPRSANAPGSPRGGWASKRPKTIQSLTPRFSLTARKPEMLSPRIEPIKISDNISMSSCYQDVLQNLLELGDAFTWFSKAQEYFFNWFRTVLKDTEQSKRSFELYVQSDMKKITFAITGRVKDVLNGLLEYCYAEELPQNEIELIKELGGMSTTQTAMTWMDVTDQNAVDWGWQILECSKLAVRNASLNKKEEQQTVLEWVTKTRQKTVDLGRNTRVLFPVSTISSKVDKDNRDVLHEIFDLCGENLPMKIVNASVGGCSDCYGRITLNEEMAIEASAVMLNVNQDLMDAICSSYPIGALNTKRIESLQSRFGQIQDVIFQSLGHETLVGSKIQGLYEEGNTLHFGFSLGKY